MRKRLLRVWLPVVLALALVAPLGWLWWDSRLPATYSAMSMGYLDHGGGPRPAAADRGHGGHGEPHGEMHGAGMEPAGSDTSVADLDGDVDPDRRPDRVFDLTTRQGQVRLAGQQVAGFTVNGTTPGPLLETRVGELVEVRLHNESVRGGVALHWHGIDVPNAQDGVAGITQDAVPTGKSFVYRWVAPDAGTYWYHSHQLSHRQVVGGLLGAVVVHPARGGPAGEARDVVALAHTYSGVQTLNGRTGTQQVPARPGELVRVRLVNTDNGSQTAWTSGPFRLLAVDGFDVHRPTPVSRRSVGIPAGGRVDLAVRVPEDGAARVDLLGDVALVIGPHGAEAAAASQPEEQLDLLDYGSPADVGFDATRPDRRFDYSIGRRPAFLDGRPGMWWSVNGHTYPDMPMFVVREGDVSVIRISNHSGAVHPMHLHGHHAVVLTRNGHAVRGSPWWFDSLDVADGDTYEVAFLADNPGVWMDHCHNLKHATEGLVTHLMYEGVSTPYLLGEGSGNEPE